MLPLVLLSDAHAFDVLVLAADIYFLDVQTKLRQTGRFDSVDVIEANMSTPTLATMQNYDAILVYSNYGFLNSATLGDRLADYVDGGGGVVVAMFAIEPVNITGRWSAQNYEPMTANTYASFTRLTLGNRYEPDHPIMDNLGAVDAGQASYRAVNPTLANQALAIAAWSNGDLAVATFETKFVGRVASVNMFPPSEDGLSGCWENNTDGDVLLANALEWSGIPDLDGDDVPDDEDNCILIKNPDQANEDSDALGDACDQCDDRVDTDTDVDGFCDDVDLCEGYDDNLDGDADGNPDDCDPCPEDNPDDDDGDGYCNSVDLCPNFDDALSPVDTDLDGTCDLKDLCPGFDDKLDEDLDTQPDACDCAPSDPLAMTDGIELCDDHDNDCDGIVDPPGSEGETSFYPDLDGDGFGDPTVTSFRCSPPLNFIANDEDCNDDISAVYPEAPEVCDGFDNDCDGVVDPGCSADEGEGEEDPNRWACSSSGSEASWLLVLAAPLLAVRRRRPE